MLSHDSNPRAPCLLLLQPPEPEALLQPGQALRPQQQQQQQGRRHRALLAPAHAPAQEPAPPLDMVCACVCVCVCACVCVCVVGGEVCVGTFLDHGPQGIGRRVQPGFGWGAYWQGSVAERLTGWDWWRRGRRGYQDAIAEGRCVGARMDATAEGEVWVPGWMLLLKGRCGCQDGCYC